MDYKFNFISTMMIHVDLVKLKKEKNVKTFQVISLEIKGLMRK